MLGKGEKRRYCLSSSLEESPRAGSHPVGAEPDFLREEDLECEFQSARPLDS